MICYRDMTFCIAKCATVDCSRKYTPEVQAAADEWWGGINDQGGPVAVSDFSPTCPDHLEVTNCDLKDESENGSTD